MSVKDIILGIDLGTTFSVIAKLEGGEPSVIPNREGKNKTPSVVAFKSRDEILVGEIAKRQSATNPKNTIFSVKRLIGKKYKEIEKEKNLFPYKIIPSPTGEILIETDYGRYTPEEISSFILKKLKEDAEIFLGTQVKKVVITVPAYFNNNQREKTKIAAELAGLEVVRLLNEPTAASLAYGKGSEKEEIIAVYDFGGGTFDITFLRVSDEICEVISTAGDTYLGGDDIDNAIVNLIIEDFKKQHDFDLSRDPVSIVRLKEAAEEAKCELSQMHETEINVPFIAAKNGQPLHLTYHLTREKLNELIEPFVNRTIQICKKALKDGNIKINQISKIVLAGGSTRIPLVVEKIKQNFNCPIFRGINPDEVVAYGAAMQGGIIDGSLTEVLLIDVTPISLGVETANDRFSVIIEKNATIPTTRSKIFTTTKNNQAIVPIHILQGESPKASENISLGYYYLTGIPPAKKGTPRIEVRFSINADGILEVLAVEKKSQKTLKVTLSPTLEDFLEYKKKATQISKREEEKKKEKEKEEKIVKSKTKSKKETTHQKTEDKVKEEKESLIQKEKSEYTTVEKALQALNNKEASIENTEIKSLYDRAIERLEDKGKKEGEVKLSDEKKLVQLYIAVGEFGKARNLLIDILTKDQKSISFVREKYDEIENKATSLPSEFFIEKAIICKTSGDIDEAIKYMEKAFSMTKEESIVDEIIDIYKEKLSLQPEDSYSALRLGELYALKKQYNKAIKYLQKAVLNPEYKQEAAKLLGISLFKKKLYYLALQQFKKCDTKDEEVKEYLYKLMEKFEKEKQYGNAIYAAEEIIAVDITYKNIMQKYAELKRLYDRFMIKQNSKIGAFEKEINIKSKEDRKKQRYINLEEINRGSMGVIYKAYDTELEEEVVLKIISEVFSEDPNAIRRFKREAKAARKLSHPNIVRIFDIGEINGKKFISMEYLKGKDLKRIIRTYGRLDEKRMIYIIKQLCFALDYAHKKGVIHRDIKPANIIITEDDIVKVSDFGIAKILKEATEVTKIGEIVGTPLYMAPEQIKGEKIDARADIYALGVLMYEMITGKPPFIEGDIAYHHLNTPPKPPKYCHPKLQRIILKCLKKDPQERYSSVKELLDDIVKYEKEVLQKNEKKT